MANNKNTIKIILVSILVILLIVFALSPLGTITGILNGDLDLYTLYPKEYELVQEQIRSEQIIQ